MYEMTIKTGEKIGRKNAEWGLSRENKIAQQISFKGDHFTRASRLFRGRPEFIAAAKERIDAYIENLRPYLYTNSTYFDLNIMFGLEFPEDTGLILEDLHGVIQVLEKRTVNYGYALVNQDIRQEPAAPGSRMYFNCVLRRATDKVSSLNLVKQEIVRGILQAYLEADAGVSQIINDSYPGTAFTNAELIQRLSRALEISEESEVMDAYRHALTDSAYVTKFVERLQKYRDEVIRPMMNRRYLGGIYFMDKGGKYAWWTMEKIANAFARYLVTDMPLRDWHDMYGTDEAFSYMPRYSALRFREASLNAGKYVINFRPPEDYYSLPFEHADVRKWPNVFHHIIDVQHSEAVRGHADTIRNYMEKGYVQALCDTELYPGQIARFGDKEFIGWEYLLPNLPAGKAVIGTKWQPDNTEVFTELTIQPDSSMFFRINEMLDSTRPTIFTVDKENGQSWKVLVLPEFGGQVRALPRVNSFEEIAPLGDDCEVAGCMEKDAYDIVLPKSVKRHFQTKLIHSVGEIDISLASIFGV